MTTKLTRADLAAIPGMTPKAIRAFEELPQRIADNESMTADAVAATQGINQATVLVLSTNDAFYNERVLAVGTGLYLTDGGPGGLLTLHLTSPIKVNGAYRVTLNALADVNLDLPVSGKLATTILPGPFSDDAAAATGGVAIGETYRKPLGLVTWRQA